MLCRLLSCLLLLLASLVSMVSAVYAKDDVGAANTIIETWGQTRQGEKVGRVSLRNDLGMTVSYIDYGATLTAISVPGRHGQFANVVLSLPSLQAYEASKRKFAAVIGRYAGRIGNASFPHEGRQVMLPKNAKGIALHGDPDGYDKRVWTRRDFADDDTVGSVYSLLSPDGDQGFPGAVRVEVRYSLYRRRNEFSIQYRASTTAATVINLTNHAYFNLAGAGSKGMSQHVFRINADRYLLTDDKRVPTGVIASVEGTVLDFREASSLTGRLSAMPALPGGVPPGIDHSLLFTDWGKNTLAQVAQITEAGSGRCMQVWTTEPSVQFNTGNSFDGTETGSEGRAYEAYDGFAFETQHLPDSPNHPDFPSVVLLPGQVFLSTTHFKFSDCN
ncbi:aldose epimerase family protein [Undibacterium sp. Ji49W]|uniref:aldose epimerase family protein n=1 Tax=Undibacterium sp. Ji49W TaxID=3413040 RepID=UPI003BF56C01